MSKAPAVDYALHIIELFGRENVDLGISDISNALGINKNAVSRILEALVERAWIYPSGKSDKKYRLTLRPFSVFANHVEKNEVVKIAKPILEDLNASLGDSVYLGVKDGENILYLLHFDSMREVRINGSVGGKYPLHCSAPGKIFLAQADENEQKEFFAHHAAARTKNTITTFEEFLAERDRINSRGYAIDNEEFADGILCVAVPIYDGDGCVIASIGISSLTIYDDPCSLQETKLKRLQDAASEIAKKIGYITQK